MSDEQRWEANRKFLDAAIARGDEFRLSTTADKARADSYYARELDYLKRRGYTITSDGKRMIKNM
jgi:hypothetical protein